MLLSWDKDRYYFVFRTKFHIFYIMRDFKFLNNNEDDGWDNLFMDGEDEQRGAGLILDASPSWIWDGEDYTIFNPDTQPYQLVTQTYNGIFNFLAGFPPGYIVVVHRIEGMESGMVHTANSERMGWGFDIQNDLIRVTYYHFLNTDHA